VSKLQSDVNGAAAWSLSSDLLFNEAKFVHVCFWAKPSFDLDTTTYSVQLMVNLSDPRLDKMKI